MAREIIREEDPTTGGLLVVLGIVLAVAIGIFLYQSNFFRDNSADLNIRAELPQVNVERISD